jgi:hypothetical protein
MTRQEREIIIKVFKILLDNQFLFTHGLCKWIRDAEEYQLINSVEYEIVDDYLLLKLNLLKKCSFFYYWKEGDLISRINWINEQIKILENEN